MVAALTNGQHDGPDLERSPMNLQEMALTAFRRAPEPMIGFGNSGNDAWVCISIATRMETKWDI